MVVRIWMGQIKCSVNRQGGLPAPSRPQDDRMSLRRQTEYFLLASNGLWQAEVHSRVPCSRPAHPVGEFYPQYALFLRPGQRLPFLIAEYTASSAELSIGVGCWSRCWTRRRAPAVDLGTALPSSTGCSHLPQAALSQVRALLDRSPPLQPANDPPAAATSVSTPQQKTGPEGPAGEDRRVADALSRLPPAAGPRRGVRRAPGARRWWRRGRRCPTRCHRRRSTPRARGRWRGRRPCPTC